MGRITPSFRQLFLRWLHDIRHRKGAPFRRASDDSNRDAFDLLIRDAWAPEMAAMAQANVHPIIDIVNLTAVVHIQAECERLAREIEALERQVDEKR